MSSNRKRSAIAKANREVDFIKQKLMLSEHHASTMETFAKMSCVKYNEKCIELHELKMKFCPETLTEKDHELYETFKKELEEFYNPPKPEPIPQLIFSEEEYNEKITMAASTTK